MSAPRKIGFSINAKHTANEVANGTPSIISKPAFGSQGFFGYGGETPPAPSTSRVLYPVAGI
jgi:hypothetical protein